MPRNITAVMGSRRAAECVARKHSELVTRIAMNFPRLDMETLDKIDRVHAFMNKAEELSDELLYDLAQRINELLS